MTNASGFQTVSTSNTHLRPLLYGVFVRASPTHGAVAPALTGLSFPVKKETTENKTNTISPVLFAFEKEA
ncbi:MAG: hypothetical protein J1F06_07490 [Prevotellaceae bacterium]|nr:hypothetical protein [Prevotellaceae bacterium]